MKKESQDAVHVEKFRFITSLVVMAVILFGGAILCLAKSPDEISLSERRKLEQFPKLSWEAVVDGEWMEDFEKYTLDQFPFRDRMRSVKAYVQQNLFMQKDNNGIYVVDGNVSKLEYPLNENSVINAAKKFNALYDKYMAGTDVKVYTSVIPDKNYFLAAENGYLSVDYEQMMKLYTKNIRNMSYIDIFGLLEEGDYYRTDSHWSQEKIVDVAMKLAEAMGVADRISGEYEMKELTPFYGVYYGQSAMSLQPDAIRYLTNEIIENCTTYNAENGKTAPVYNLEKFSGMDPYDIFLSGATPLITITNPAGEKGKELVIFRDSFASSLAPLLIEGYETITLVDIRYMHSNLLPNYIEFKDQDVLFLYSTMVLNSSNMLH